MLSKPRVRVTSVVPTFAAVRHAARARLGAAATDMVRLLMCGGVALAASGCSLSIPIAGFVSDTTPVGSIERPDALIFKALDQEDGRRARAALAVALDPQGNGQNVGWSNPQSGAKGSFSAAAAPYSRAEQVCRAFRADVAVAQQAGRAVEGAACRNGEGEWLVSEARDVKPTKADGTPAHS